MVIPTYSTERVGDVLACIRSLVNQTLQPKEILLVLDPNRALKDSYEARVSNGVKLVVSEAYGLSSARNAGVKNAEGEIVAFIDDDAFAERKWLANLVRNYDDPSVVGVGGFIEPLWEGGRPLWFPEELDWIVGCSYKGLPEEKARVRNPIGCNMSFRKSVFEDAGYFRPNLGRIGKRLLAGEEADLSLRILEKNPGSMIVYDPEAVVHHRVPKSRSSLEYCLRRSFYEGLSKAFIVKSTNISKNVLSTETNYLTHIRSALLSRLKRWRKLEDAYQLLTLVLALSSVFTGYVAGRLQTL